MIPSVSHINQSTTSHPISRSVLILSSNPHLGCINAAFRLRFYKTSSSLPVQLPAMSAWLNRPNNLVNSTNYEVGYFRSPKCPHWLCGPPSLQPNGYRGSLSGVKGPRCQVGHFPSSREQVKNEKSHTSTPTRLHGVGTNNCHLLGAFAKLRKAAIGFVRSVFPHGTTHNSVSAGRSFMKFSIWVFFGSLSRKISFHSTLKRITGTLHENLWAFMIITDWILQKMTCFWPERQRKSKHISRSIAFLFRKSCRLSDVAKYTREASHRWQFGVWAVHARYLRLQTHAVCNTYCFSIAKIPTRTRISVTLYVNCTTCYLHMT